MDNTLQTSRRRSTKFNRFGPLAFGVLMLPAAGRAADLPRTWQASDLRIQLVACGKSLSANDMAKQKGTGLSHPGLADQKTDGVPRVLLWDEMRRGPMPQPARDGVVTGGGIGK